jgi:hypothetical protein
MKREVRLPTKGYDLLRQQVQAKRRSPTNRMLPEESSSADLSDSTAEKGALESMDDLSPSARDVAAEGPALGHSAGGEEAPTQTSAAKSSESGASDPGTKPERRPTQRESKARPSRDTAPLPRPVATGRITLKINLTAPAAGVFPFYDRVIETMPPRKAVPLLLAKAFEELEASAVRGHEIRLEDYKMERKGERISTSRTMDAETFEILRARVDPHNLMRQSSLGAVLATSALSLYLRRHS